MLLRNVELCDAIIADLLIVYYNPSLELKFNIFSKKLSIATFGLSES